ncbi:hypothetical protein LWI28_018585 [Acer negundo]|uniref:Uncharacterized protein n=1 Tax=Acer negundo TaxID=4023 RepID=A0AAD5NKE1_ACENE|nr:hypothetical protein LWI28_018585 [Acer negundo]KAK4843291.1 hypothetical protein QYF36_006470 [Acer negundo]
MSCYSNQEQEQQMPFINYPSEEGEEELLLLQETTAVDSPSATNGFSLLNLHAFPPSSSSSASASAHSHLHCTHCGSHKRSSPEPSSFAAHDHQQPKHKKPSFHGFSKIPLPTQVVTNTATQVLSDPPQSPPQNAEIARPETPLSSAVRASAAAKLPPRAPTLRRTVSDPNVSPSRGTIGGYESPNDKLRLRRMQNCIREMNKWWDEILPEEESAVINNNGAKNLENSEADIEESVSVERAGENLIIHFKCPCGKGYEILISGRNCYYKLM